MDELFVERGEFEPRAVHLSHRPELLWWFNIRALPIALVIMSVTAISINLTLQSAFVRTFLTWPTEPEPPTNALQGDARRSLSPIGRNICSNGGIVIWTFKVVRLIAIFALLGLSIPQATARTHNQGYFSMSSFQTQWDDRALGKLNPHEPSLLEDLHYSWMTFYVRSSSSHNIYTVLSNYYRRILRFLQFLRPLLPCGSET